MSRSLAVILVIAAVAATAIAVRLYDVAHPARTTVRVHFCPKDAPDPVCEGMGR